MRFDKSSLLLYAVTDRAWVGKHSLYEQVEAALRGGVTCVQLREKELAQDEFLAEAIAIRELCRSCGVLFFVNDDVEIAVKCGADGIHVGQTDMEVGEVRRLVGEKMLIGVSVHSVEQAIQAVKSGADCLGVGAIFSTSTKTDAELVPLDTLRAICSATEAPVVAIGGLNRSNISSLSGSGVAGAALVSAIFASDDIERECRTLRRLCEAVVNGGVPNEA